MHIFKESLPLINRNNISDIKECLVIEIDVNNQMKKMFLFQFIMRQVKIMMS